jgi:hypothetical protein
MAHLSVDVVALMGAWLAVFEYFRFVDNPDRTNGSSMGAKP